MSVSKKLTLGFFIVLLLATVVSIIGIVGIQNLRESGSYMYERRVTSLSYVTSAKNAFDKMRINIRGIVIDSLFDDKKSAMDDMDAFEQNVIDFTHWMEQSRAISDTDELRVFHDRLLDLFNNFYLPSVRRVATHSIEDIPDHKNKLSINAELAYIFTVTEKIDSYATGLVDLNTALAKQTDIDNAWLARIYVSLQIVLLFVAILVAVLVARTVIKGIATPIREAADVLGNLAEGKFDTQITGDYKGEFETIKNSVNSAAEQLFAYVTELSVYMQETMLAQQMAHKTSLDKARIEAASEAMFSGINYASSIQRNILPPDSAFEEIFSDHSIIWEPRDIVGGDIYWLKTFESGSVLCVCDCTGHGTPGALLTMLVTSILDSVINKDNCADTARIVYMLDKRLSVALNVNTDSEKRRVKDGCDIAVLFIARDGSVTVSSAHTRVFVCNGEDVTHIKGQNIYVGEGILKKKEYVKITTIPANDDNKFYIASDGLYDQTGGENDLPFGYKRFMKLILENHNEPQASITQKIWDAFEEHRGAEVRLDDFELLTFKIQSSREILDEWFIR